MELVRMVVTASPQIVSALLALRLSEYALID